MILFILLALLVILLYTKVVKRFNYWTTRGVKQRKQTFLCGDFGPTLFKKENFYDMLIKLYNSFPEERYTGMYQFALPTLILKDPDLIKQIGVKEFDHFPDHRQLAPEGAEPLWTKNLFSLKGSYWRQMRTALSPSFTSSKMRIIFNLISECSDEYLKYFKKTHDTGPIELKDIFTRYTNDVVATVAFGIKCDSITEKTNEFYVMGKDVTTFTLGRNMRFFAYNFMPRLAKACGVRLFPRRITDFFKNLVINTIKTREEQGIVRPDMIHLLLEARKGKKRIEEHAIIDAGFATVEEIIKEDPPEKLEISDMDIAAQALLFFFGGFESVSTVMCFMGYELTINPDIQKRLQEEIDETMKDCNGKLTYEALVKMRYMDMVVSETLRKWPPTPISDRVCAKRFTIDAVSPSEKPVTLEIGDVVWIPISGIHRDPKYYPNPEKFDPERFNDENKDNIKPYTYIPFGVGPRNCIGSRFALLEVKAIFFHILRYFDLVVVDKTEIPLKISKTVFNLSSENGIWVGLKPRMV